MIDEGIGTGKSRSLDKPLPSETTSGAHLALIEPVGEFALDIRFRMLQPHELALAQGFPRDYKFSGTKTEITKQIGNAVPVNLSRELAYCCLMTGVA